MNSAIVVLLLLSVTIVAGRRILDWREVAKRCAARACRSMNLQLLDASVSWRALRLNRQYWRSEVHYDFDFSDDGMARHRGRIKLIGGEPIQVVLNSEQLGQVVVDASGW